MPVDYKERARKRAKERTSGFWFKLEPRENTFRILPTPESDSTPGVFMEYAIHRDVGKNKLTVRCGKDPITEKGRCWLCDKKIPQLREIGKESRAAALEPASVTILQVAVLTPEGKLEGPRGFNPSKKVGDSIIGSILGSKKRDYVDAENGYNISITRHGTGKNDTRYDPIEPDEESSTVAESIIKKLKPFSELKEIPVYDEAKQRAAFEGRDADDVADDDDDDDDVTPPKKKATKVESAEDDDDDDASAEADDDDEEPPAKKPQLVKGKKKPEPEPDDDDDDAADDDDDVPVTKSKKKPEPVEDDDDVPVVKAKKKKVEADDDDDDGEPVNKKKAKKPVEDDDDEEPPAKVKGKKPADDDDDDDLEAADADDDDNPPDDDEEELPKRKTLPPPPAKKKKK